MKKFNFYFDTINEFYAQKCAERSGVPYMAHIMEGLNVLEAIGTKLNGASVDWSFIREQLKQKKLL